MKATVLKLLSGLITMMILAGCSNPADNVPAATVNAASDAPSAPQAESEARHFAFGPEGSSIQFVGSKVTGKHDGGFRNFTGEFAVTDGRLAGAGNKVVIDVSSIWSDNNRLTGHLKSPDFFDVAQFPTATFETTMVDQKGGESMVTGNLRLHGITKQIAFPAKIEVNETAVNVNAEFFLNRFDFDMKYPGKADDLIRKEVVLKFNVRATAGKADFAKIDETARAGASAPQPQRAARPR